MSRKSSYKNSNSNSNISSKLPSPSVSLNKSKNISPSYDFKGQGFLQSIKEGFALGIGSSVGQLLTYSVFGGPKVTVEHSYNDNDDINKINPCVNNSQKNFGDSSQNCSQLLLELEKCKCDYNLNFDKLDKLKNDYEKCKSNQ
jgi:hypothetical protein